MLMTRLYRKLNKANHTIRVLRLERDVAAIQSEEECKGLEAKIEALEGELKASEDGSGITNIKEQFEAQLRAIDSKARLRFDSEPVKVGL